MIPFNLKNQERVIGRVYSSTIEDKAKEQLINLGNLDGFCFLKAFPDIHAGADFPVGYVMKTRDTFYPQLTGADIGCSVAGLQINLPASLKEEKFIDEVSSYVQTEFTGTRDLPSLGGGNHFFDISRDEYGHLWMIVHTGSRGIGGRCYKKIKKEMELNNLESINVRSRLYNFVIKQLFEEAEEAAEENIYGIISKITHKFNLFFDQEGDIRTEHNTIRQIGRDVYHYKGASYVEKEGDAALVPLSMRDGTLLIRVWKPSDLFWGINHGAGRTMSRRKANETLDASSLDGINYLSERIPIDEAPDAYKNITGDMEWFVDENYITIERKLTPIITVKE